MLKQPALASAKTLAFILLFMVFSSSMAAQTGRPSPAETTDKRAVLRVKPFSGEGIGTREVAAIQNLVTSYIVELRGYRVIDAGGQELALQEAETAINLGTPKDISPLAADYLVTGSVLAAAQVFVFTLEVTKVSSGEKKSVSDALSSQNEVILAARRMTRALFEAQDTQQNSTTIPTPGTGAGTISETPGSTPVPTGSSFFGSATVPNPSSQTQNLQSIKAQPTPKISKIAGTWKGDKGVDRISLFPDGRGIAVLSSGATMKIRMKVSGAVIEVTQDQPNIPEFYRGTGIDLIAARKVAQAARPWRWVFSLSENGEQLFGIKESVFVKIDSTGGVSVDNAYVREAVWNRSLR